MSSQAIAAPTQELSAPALELAALLDQAAPSDVRALLSAARASDQPDAGSLDPALWGAAPSASAVASGALSNLRRQFDTRRSVETESIGRTQAAGLLGVSEQAVTDYLEAHRLLGLKRGRRWLIPAWQFDADSQRGILPGLKELADAFPGGLVALTLWVTTSSADLDDRQPRDVLATGEVPRVLDLAENLTAAGW